MAAEEPRPVKRRRLLDGSGSSSPKTQPATPPESMVEFPNLDHWPDDIIVHLLQFLDCDTLESFSSTCRRIRFFVRRNLKTLLDPIIASLPLADEIQHLLDARSQLQPSAIPPRPSFSYIRLHKRTYSDFETIAETANPVKTCPRSTIHPDIDFDFLQPSQLHFFRSSYCYYFHSPIESIARFWTIFWEFKRVKAEDPEGFKDKVSTWAWKRYSFRDILGVARFNGSYYSRIITSSLNCQRDALKLVLEIYKSRTRDHETWNVEEGVLSLHWHMSISRNSVSEYRTGQIPPGIERFPVSIPITVSVTADITPSASTSRHIFVSHLAGVDLALSRLADFGNVYNATIDKSWETRNMVKTVEFQDFFDFVWGPLMGDKAADIMAEEANKFLDLA